MHTLNLLPTTTLSLRSPFEVIYALFPSYLKVKGCSEVDKQVQGVVKVEVDGGCDVDSHNGKGETITEFDSTPHNGLIMEKLKTHYQNKINFELLFVKNYNV